MILSSSLSPCLFALALLQSVTAEDTVSSGNYLIHQCNAGEPNSLASKMQDLLPQVYDGLQKVIADLNQSTGSLHGYSVFFKNDSSKGEVLQVYQKMAAGASVAGSQKGSSPRHPTFICARNVPGTDLLYQFCAKHENAALMTWTHTELMPICSRFWSIKSKSKLRDCPLVVANTLVPNDDRLLRNQEALLVGILVHLYHNVDQGLITTITDISEMDASESLLNAPNYALYYAGRYLVFPNSPSINLANKNQTR